MNVAAPPTRSTTRRSLRGSSGGGSVPPGVDPGEGGREVPVEAGDEEEPPAAGEPGGQASESRDRHEERRRSPEEFQSHPRAGGRDGLVDAGDDRSLRGRKGDQKGECSDDVDERDRHRGNEDRAGQGLPRFHDLLRDDRRELEPRECETELGEDENESELRKARKEMSEADRVRGTETNP